MQQIGKNKKSPAQIANILNLHKGVIYNIIIGKCYSNISGITERPYPKREIKLNAEKAIEIVKLYNIEKYSIIDLCEKFNVKKSLIRNVLRDLAFSKETGISKERPDKFSKKLTHENVLKIVNMFNSERKTYLEIGKLMNINRVTVRKIICGEIWSSVTGINKEEYRKQNIIHKKDFSGFTSENIAKIMSMYNNDKLSFTKIGELLNLDRRVISDIMNGKAYSDITGIVKPIKTSPNLPPISTP